MTDPSTIILNGRQLTVASLWRVASRKSVAAIETETLDKVDLAWDLAQQILRTGGTVYGFTTGVGAHSSTKPPQDARREYNRLLVENHRSGWEPYASDLLSRAALATLLNGICRGQSSVQRVTVAELLSHLNSKRALPMVRLRGTVGQADLAPLADLVAGLQLTLDGPESLILIASNAYAIASASLACVALDELVKSATNSTALAFEAFRANLSPLDPELSDTVEWPALIKMRSLLLDLLRGGALADEGEARNLQDPLTFRNAGALLATLMDIADATRHVAERHLNMVQVSPISLTSSGRAVSAAPYDMTGLAIALDHARLGVAHLVTTSVERTIKLLNSSHSGLSQGLTFPGAGALDGFSELGVSIQAFACEARLLAAPVSLELVSTTQAAGVEDRTSMAELAARRLHEQIELAEVIIAAELVTSAQAIDLRNVTGRLGAGAAKIFESVRNCTPMMGPDQSLPSINAVVQHLRRARPGSILLVGSR